MCGWNVKGVKCCSNFIKKGAHGFEPWTCWSAVSRSTTELHAQKKTSILLSKDLHKAHTQLGVAFYTTFYFNSLYFLLTTVNIKSNQTKYKNVSYYSSLSLFCFNCFWSLSHIKLSFKFTFAWQKNRHYLFRGFVTYIKSTCKNK